MVVLGIILLLLGLGLGGFVVLAGVPVSESTQVSFTLFDITVETSAVAVFALGALVLLLLELAVMAIRSGARKSARKRAELQRLRRVEAEVQARQSTEAQRNAAAAPVAPAPAPFARREPATPVRSDSADDTTRADLSSTGSTDTTGSRDTTANDHERTRDDERA